MLHITLTNKKLNKTEDEEKKNHLLKLNDGFHGETA